MINTNKLNEEQGKKPLNSYITDIKELPPNDEELKEAKKAPEQTLAEEKSSEYSQYQTKSTATTSQLDGTVSIEESEVQEGSRRPFSTKDIILAVVNLVSIILLIIILVRFPDKARELKELKLDELRSQSKVPLESSEVGANKQKADQLAGLFLEEDGIVKFVNEVEEIKNETGVITKISFANQKALKDKTGSFGLPVAIELSGSWSDIDAGLQKINELPFLTRDSRIEIESSEEDPSVLVFKYGLILYVSDKLGESR